MAITELILNSGLLVQAVMILLLFMSILSWAIAIAKGSEIRKAKEKAAEFDELFWNTPELTSLFNDVSNEVIPQSSNSAIFLAGFKEFIRLKKQGVNDANDLVGASQRAMRVAFSKEIEKIENRIPMLATIASTAPYIGLFGTVWGVMNAFVALGDIQHATLATVAPGISEALIATAIGLFVAIPATMFFNSLSVKSDKVIAQYENFAEGFLTIIQRQAHIIEKRAAEAQLHSQAQVG